MLILRTTMATERQRTANRANAAKSTGPRSPGGKAASARNATTHGLTTPPPFDRVARWVRILLDNEDATTEDLEGTPYGDATIRLAEAEACLERALFAEREAALKLATYAKTHEELDLLHLPLNPVDYEDPAVLEAILRSSIEEDFKEGIRILLKDHDNRLPKLVKKLDRIQRYLRQAERRKAKAFAAWLSARRVAISQNEANFNHGLINTLTP